jgi:hypothetical protein
MIIEDIYIAEAYTTQTPPGGAPAVSIQPQSLSQNNNEQVKKSEGIKDWIRLPFIDTPFKARMAAVLIVELILNLTRDQDLRDMVLKEIRTNSRLQKKR